MKKQITVLIADDNNHIRETLKTLLEGNDDISVIGEAKNGEEAIKMALGLSPDIVIMDINMSPVNGFEATRKILKVDPSIKIIGLSMHKESSYCNNMMRLGAKGYLVKSSSYSEIIVAIKEVSAGRKYIDKDVQGTL